VSDLGDALCAMQDAKPGYVKAQAYAHGPINEVFASRKLKRLLQNNGVTFQTVLGGVVIGAVADKLKVLSVTTDNDDATEALAKVDKANLMSLVRPQVIRKTLELGDAYLVAWPKLDENGEVVPGEVTISYNDPRTVRVLYDPDNPMVKRLMIKRWAVDGHVRVDLVYDDRIEHYITKQKNGRSFDERDFEPYVPEGAAGSEEPNPHGIPAFHFTTAIPGEYGEPEHKLFFGTQDKLNKLTVSHMGGVDYYSIPQRYATLEPGVDTSEAAAMDEDEFIVSADGKGTRHVDGEGNAQLSGSPGSLWLQKGIKSYGQFDTAPPANFLEPEVHYLNEGAVATATPPYLFNPSADFPSGKALKTANAPLDAKAGQRQESIDCTFVEFYTYVLKLLGFDGVTVSLSWAPVETTDEDEKLDNAAKKQGLGVPVAQTLHELDYEDTEVEKWMADGEGLLPQKVLLLQGLADVVQKLTPAMSTGAIDPALVNGILTALFKDVTGDGAETANAA
jgi:hypothetical protein